MKKKKSIIIAVVIIVIIILLLIGISVITNKNKPKPMEVKDPLIGEWIAYKQEVYKEGKFLTTIELDGKSVEIKKGNKINICYTENEEKTCEEVGYTYDGEIMNIEDNGLYLKGDVKVNLEEDAISFSSTLDTVESILYFFKMQ